MAALLAKYRNLDNPANLPRRGCTQSISSCEPLFWAQGPTGERHNRDHHLLRMCPTPAAWATRCCLTAAYRRRPGGPIGLANAEHVPELASRALRRCRRRAVPEPEFKCPGLRRRYRTRGLFVRCRLGGRRQPDRSRLHVFVAAFDCVEDGAMCGPAPSPRTMPKRSSLALACIRVLSSRSYLSPQAPAQSRARVCSRLTTARRSTAQLTVLPCKRLDPLAIFARHAGTRPAVAFSLPHPSAQRLRRASGLRRHRADRFPLGRMIDLMIQNQPDSPLADIRRISCCVSLYNGSSFSQVRASRKPGAVTHCRPLVCTPRHRFSQE